jgi:hypothetical protein
VVGGQPVTWYAADKDSAGYADAIETLLPLPATDDGYRPVAHVWVYTSTPEEQAAILRLLSEIEFKSPF